MAQKKTIPTYFRMASGTLTDHIRFDGYGKTYVITEFETGQITTTCAHYMSFVECSERAKDITDLRFTEITKQEFETAKTKLIEYLKKL